MSGPGHRAEAAGDAAGTRAAVERAIELYEMKGAAALADRARGLVGDPPAAVVPKAQALAESVDLDNACVWAVDRLNAAWQQGDWDAVGQFLASSVFFESRRRIVGSSSMRLSPADWTTQARGFPDTGLVRIRRVTIAIRGDRLALFRMRFGTADHSQGAAEDQLLHLLGLDDDGLIALHILFDVEDMDAALAELDARVEQTEPSRGLENAASRASQRYIAKFAARDWNAMRAALAPDYSGDDRRRVVVAGIRRGRGFRDRQFSRHRRCRGAIEIHRHRDPR